MPPRFEWDDTKDRRNPTKHGISFEEARLIFDGPVLTKVDDRQDYGEERFISYGQFGLQVIVAVVHTTRDGVTRLISARKANRAEKKDYYEHLEKTAQGN